MQKTFLGLFLTFSFQLVVAQNAYKISYDKFSNGIKIDEDNPIAVWANEEKSIIANQNSFNKTTSFPNEMTLFFKNDSVFNQIAYFSNDSIITTKNKNNYTLKDFKKTKKTKRILGIRTKHAEIMVNSNKIDLWYVDNMNIQAAPNAIGLPLGFILEYERNNNYTIRVSKIDELKKSNTPTFTAIDLDNHYVEPLDYNYLMWKNKFVTVPIFTQQQIHFSDQFEAQPNVLRFANGTVVVKKVKIPTLNSTDHIFLEVNQISNGDAYDRTGSIFLIPTKNSPNFLEGMQKGLETLPFYSNGNGKKYQGVVHQNNYEPLVELMRFFTPFGIQKYNYINLKNRDWQKEASYRQDISELKNLMSDQEVYIGAFIGNYDKGGHILDAEISIHKGGKSLLPSQKIIPLFNTLNVMEMGGQEYGSMFNDKDGLMVEFELKEDINNAQLRYITSGHGGWENGDEFLPKQNFITLNGKEIFNLAPWRVECGSYRDMNPASGNFENGLSSSDYSRSNWCPGTVTNPYYIPIGDLKAGKHKIQVVIPQGENEGNSFSFWSVSGVLIGE